MKRFLLAALLLLSVGTATGQNTQCPTRPFGDNTNACASTAFTQQAIAPLPSGLAGPTATIGYSPIAGVATTGLRSDGASALAPFVQNTLIAVPGLACDGTTDDSATLQAALNAATAPATLALPQGKCIFHGITLPTGVSLRGTSTDGTVVSPSGNNQTIFAHVYGVLTQATFGISNLTIDCKAFTGVTGISVTFAKETQWQNLDFAGCATAMVFDRGYDYKISNISSRGNASLGAGQIKIWSSDDADYIFNVYLINVTTLNIGNGVQADALYLRRAVNSYITNYGANDLSTGGTPRNALVIENDCQGVFVNNFIAAAAAVGILIQTGAGVAIAPSFNVISNFGIDQSSTNAISVSSGTYNKISVGVVAASGVSTGINAINVSGGSFNTIESVTIKGYNGASGTAINFSAGVADWSLYGNRLDTNHTCINLAGTNTNFRVMYNTCTNMTATVSGSAAGGNNLFTGNLGIGFLSNVPAVYQDAAHGLVLVMANGGTYDGGFFGRGGNELFANIAGTNDLRFVGDPNSSVAQGHIRTGQFPPTPGAGCGAAPIIIGSDSFGELKMGTGYIGGATCALVFNVGFINKPLCTVTWQTNLSSMSYNPTPSVLNISQNSISSNFINWQCVGQTGG